MNKTARLFVALAACSGLLAVAIGAFGAHSLEGRLSEELLAVFRTGADYHFYHTLALLAVGLAAPHCRSRLLVASGWSFLAGIVLFSGSLYALALSGDRALGAITPLGGLLFMVGWGLLAAAALMIRRESGQSDLDRIRHN